MLVERFKVPVGLLVILSAVACERTVERDATTDESRRVVLYTSLPEDRAADLVSAYPSVSGTTVLHMLGPADELISKMAEKAHHPGPDVLVIAGAGALADAVDEDVLRPLPASVSDTSVAPAYRDPDGYWVGVGVRSEAIVFDKRAVETGQITSYEALGDEEWKEKLCLASVSSDRGLTLIASMIARLGERNAELAVRGWRTNLATSIFDDQLDLLAAIDDGSCAVGIVSSEVLARFIAEGGGSNLGFVFPSAASGGTRFDVIAAGVSRHANDSDAAAEFIEWLISPAGQEVLHAGTFGHSMAEASVRAPLAGWPGFADSPVGVSRAGQLHPEATLLIERVRMR